MKNINFLGHKLNGHHLLEFSTSIDNQTSLSLSKLKIRLATLWLMVGSYPNAMANSPAHSTNDIVQLSHKESSSKHSASVNTLLLKKSNNQSRRKRKKRKRKNGIESDSNLYYFENHSYNHITNNNNGNHIIKSNNNVNRGRRRVKPVDSITFNNASKTRTENNHLKNLTLWIFRIKKPIDKFNENGHSVTDKVRLQPAAPSSVWSSK